ncbi:hypothetical protein HYZ97_04730 [Candidatus Pacearchaeota archaeon]|nr:hypothetical protein [Candidatus Pacearchaeota archaeon]
MKQDVSVRGPGGAYTLHLRENNAATKKLEFIYAALEWLHLLSGEKMPIHIYTAALPWIKKKQPDTPHIYSSVCAEFNDQRVIVLHNELSEKEVIAELVRQAIHAMNPHLGEQTLQARTIDYLERIITNYDFITHPNTHLHFHARNISPYEISKGTFMKSGENQLQAGTYGVTKENYKKLAKTVAFAKPALRIASGIFILSSVITSIQTLTGNVIIDSPEKSSLFSICLFLLGISLLLFSFVVKE